MDFHCSDCRCRCRRLIDGGIRPCLLPFSLNRLEEESFTWGLRCVLHPHYAYHTRILLHKFSFWLLDENTSEVLLHIFCWFHLKNILSQILFLNERILFAKTAFHFIWFIRFGGGYKVCIRSGAHSIKIALLRSTSWLCFAMLGSCSIFESVCNARTWSRQDIISSSWVCACLFFAIHSNLRIVHIHWLFNYDYYCYCSEL